MKFNSGIILALLAASASAKAIDNISVGSIGGAKCIASMTLMKGCMEAIASTGGQQDVCPIYESDKCKDFINNINEDNSDCSDTVKLMIDSLRFRYYAQCVKDENNKLCPFQKAITEEMKGTEIDTSMKTEESKKSMEDLEKAVDDSCYSEKCVDGLKKALEIMKKIGESPESQSSTTVDTATIDKMQAKVDTCKPTSKSSKETSKSSKESATSDASKLVQWSGIYLLGLLSLFFMNF